VKEIHQRMKNRKLGLLILTILVLACSKSDEPIVGPKVQPIANSGAEVQDFMWKAMNYWYFWQAEVPNLADDKFPNTSEGSENYTEFLLSEEDPANFFNNKLRFSEDRFSFFNSDYRVLTNSLSGIQRSNGLKFGLVRFRDSDDLFGYVRYIIPNSNASTKNIARGDLFTGVNGQTLTLNNYRDLLFGDENTYTLNMAESMENTIVANAEEVTLTKEEGLQEDPILVDKIFEIQDKKIGYLMYNQFLNEFDEQLNEVFGRFKAGGVTDLVLDLRYNPGGSVRTTVLLGSMIYGTNGNDVFLNARYNAKYQKILEDNDNETRRFFADKTPAGKAINTLNLSKVYIIATGSSASASELVINGLDPYLDIVHIGETTRGKNEFSITMVDDRESNFGPYLFNPERVNQIKEGNDWAIQPLIGRNENSEGFSDYTSGFTPDIELSEDLMNLGVLGVESEPLLAKALEQITGVSGKRDFTVKMPAKVFVGSEMFTPTKDNMWVEKIAGF
jgi:C-terminal processing protease CtpA/Prc